MSRAELAQQLEKPGRGQHQVHVARHGLDDDPGDLRALPFEHAAQLAHIVVVQYQRLCRRFLGHARRARMAEGEGAGAGFHQQRVGMPVVAAFELDDQLAAGEAAREADRGHRRLGARGHQAHALDRRHELADALGELRFFRRWRAVGQRARGCRLHRSDDCGVGVSEQHRAPGADVIDIAPAFCIPQVRAGSALEEPRRATYGTKRAHRRVHAAGNHALRALEEGFVLHAKSFP